MKANETINEEDAARVKEDLEQGNYFNKARQWYDELYHRPLYERTYFIVVTFFSAMTIWLSSQVYLSMFPLNPVVPYFITSPNIVDEYPVISPLRKQPAEDINIAIARFLVTNYVEVRENFHHDMTRLEWNFNRIRSTTGEEEFSQYQREVNPQNPASPFNKYGREAKRDVSIYDVRLFLESEPRQAKVRFTSDVTRGREVETQNWEANITFRFPPLTVNQETNNVMQMNPTKGDYEEMREIFFQVEKYSVQELTGL